MPRISTTRPQRLSVDVVIDAQALRDDADAALRSVLNGRPETHVVRATRHGADRVFEQLMGDIVVLLSPPAPLRPDALAQVEQAFAVDAGLDLLVEPALTPTAPATGLTPWSIEQLRHGDGFGPLIAMRGGLARGLGGVAAARFPHHRWDLLLRAAEMGLRVQCTSGALTQPTGRTMPQSPESRRRGRQVLHQHLERSGLRALAEIDAATGGFRVRHMPVPLPPVTIIVTSPAAGHPDAEAHCAALQATLDAMLHLAGPGAKEVIVITDDTLPDAELRRLRELCEGAADLIPVANPTGAAWRHVDIAASLATGDLFVLAGDTAVIETPDWLGKLATPALEANIGAVAAVERRDDTASPASGPPAGGYVAIRREVFARLAALPPRHRDLPLPDSLTLLGLTARVHRAVYFHRHHRRHDAELVATGP